MILRRNNIYLIILIACVAGYIWLAKNILYPPVIQSKETSICFLKHFTNIPCPSCGSTRSLLCILNGDFLKGLYLNPLGYVLLIIMIVAPVWVVFDLFNKRETLFSFYQKTELFLSKRTVAIPAIILIVINWVWNIYKGI